MTLPKIKTLLIAAAALALSAAPAAAQSPVSTPSAKTLYRNGPSGRFLMDGTWLRKLDNRQSGPQRETGTAGWTRVTVPNAWNAGDNSDASFAGGVGWYRKDFRFPSNSRNRLVGGALRVGQLPLEGVAQRPADRHEPRRLPALRVPAAHAATSAAAGSTTS